MSEIPVAPGSRLEPEDEARADFYALLGRLYADPPDAGLLAAIAKAPTLSPATSASEGNDAATQLKAAWDDLRAASASADPDAVREEFLALFVGVGRSEVSLYASHYLGPQSGRPLAEVRAALSELGLARRPESSEFEDHLSVLFETMRMLVGGDGERASADIARQRWFFDRHLAAWSADCCTAIVQSPVANYYRRVAQFCSCFVALERDSLAMD
ncbi:MAG: molecular chaperone TorD family protein [Betaproteobacteria bacterium]